MANTTEHISIRLPKWLVEELRDQAKAADRSLAWMIGYRCAQLAGDSSNRIGRSVGGGKTALLMAQAAAYASNETDAKIAIVRQKPAHDPTCRCYICKPPK